MTGGLFNRDDRYQFRFPNRRFDPLWLAASDGKDMRHRVRLADTSVRQHRFRPPRRRRTTAVSLSPPTGRRNGHLSPPPGPTGRGLLAPIAALSMAAQLPCMRDRSKAATSAAYRRRTLSP